MECDESKLAVKEKHTENTDHLCKLEIDGKKKTKNDFEPIKVVV
jgi:hypothetical protein